VIKVFRWPLIFVRVSSLFIFFLLSEQFAVFLQRPLCYRRQGLLKLLPPSFVTDGLQCARDSLCPEYPLYGSSLKGLIPESVLKRPVDVVAAIVFFHAEDVPGVESAVAGVLPGKPLQELLRGLSQLHKGLPYRLKTIAYSFRLEVLRVLYSWAKSPD
jgi:hypothetical protein